MQSAAMFAIPFVSITSVVTQQSGDCEDVFHGAMPLILTFKRPEHAQFVNDRIIKGRHVEAHINLWNGNGDSSIGVFIAVDDQSGFGLTMDEYRLIHEIAEGPGPILMPFQGAPLTAVIFGLNVDTEEECVAEVIRNRGKTGCFYCCVGHITGRKVQDVYEGVDTCLDPVLVRWSDYTCLPADDFEQKVKSCYLASRS